MVQLTVRIPEALHAKIVQEAGRAGVTANAYVAAVLEFASRRGWSVEKRPAAEVVEPR